MDVSTSALAEHITNSTENSAILAHPPSTLLAEIEWPKTCHQLRPGPSPSTLPYLTFQTRKHEQ